MDFIKNNPNSELKILKVVSLKPGMNKNEYTVNLRINRQEPFNKDPMLSVLNSAAYTCVDEFEDLRNLKQFNVRTKKITKNKENRCHICDKVLADAFTLSEHIRVHTGEKPLRCSICDKTFRFTSNLKRHQRAHKDYRCLTCKENCFNIENLQAHMKQHENEVPYRCGVCDKTFVRKKFYSTHIKSHKKVQQQFRCTFCDKLCSDSYELIEHVRLHNADKPHKCNLCEISFQRIYDLNQHMKTHRKIKTRYRCTKCQCKFLDKATLEDHFKTHLGEKSNKCSLCEKSFSYKFTLQAHMRAHSIVYSCYKCCKMFNKKEILDVHLAVCDGKNQEADKNKVLYNKQQLENENS